MKSRPIGIAVGRREVSAVVLSRRGGTAKVTFECAVPRPAGTSVAEALRAALAALPEEFRKGAPVFLALSPLDLATDDFWEAPRGMSSRALAEILPALVEERTLGETLEGLAFDVRKVGPTLRAAALPAEDAAGLAGTLREAGLVPARLTSITAALAAAFPEPAETRLLWAGFSLSLRRDPGGAVIREASPAGDEDASELHPPLSWKGIEVTSPGRAAALAAVAAPTDLVPCALRGLPGAPRSWTERFRGPLLAASFSAAALLLATGLHFRTERRACEAELAALERAESELWERHFPGRRRDGELARALRKALAQEEAASETPSAFALFGELARNFPDAEALGISLQALELSSETGGRLQAVIPAASGDPLRTAAHLEEKLSESRLFRARGDFEAQGSVVQVRLRLELRRP